MFVGDDDTVNSRGCGNIFLDICRMCFNYSEQKPRQRCHASWNRNCLGTRFGCFDLLSRSHLRCSFQSGRHHCFCFHQKFSIVTGQLITIILFSIMVINYDLFSMYFLQVPAYISAQVLGATIASGTLKLIFSGTHDQFSGTLPSGSNLQTFVFEFIITFYLMFIICGVATDSRAVKSPNISYAYQ